MGKSGLSKSRIDQMSDVLQGHIDRKELPGLVAVVCRDDDEYIEAFGELRFGDEVPMRRDSIFRIASLTKVVTAVAAMILVEDCVLRLDDPIDKWLPELANRRVLKSVEAQLTETVPAERAITVRDLLTYRMGFGSVMADADAYPIQRAIRENQIGGDAPKLPTDYPSMDEWLRRLGSLPLIAQPGERWMYNVSGDVLGALIARASGKSLETFMHERIFEPLEMVDTSFFVPDEKRDRVPGFYARNQQTGHLEFFDDIEHSAWHAPPAFESGAGGLVSTADDYLAFSRMLLNYGRYDDERILSRATVELMTSNQLHPHNRKGAEMFFGEHSSWGLGFAVDIARRDIYHSPGRFGWTGGFGTTAYVDPENDVIGILFTQRMMDSPVPPKIFTDFWTAAYAAMKQASGRHGGLTKRSP